MTPAQRSLYWREWQRVTRVYPDADRHDLHIQALGEDKSSSAFTNADLDKVLATFYAITRPADFSAQMRQERMATTRAVYALDTALACLRLYVADAGAYRDAIIRDRWADCSVDDLVPEQLAALRMTIWARINGADGLRNQAGHSLHDMYSAAGVQCACKRCRTPSDSATARRPILNAQPAIA